MVQPFSDFGKTRRLFSTVVRCQPTPFPMGGGNEVSLVPVQAQCANLCHEQEARSILAAVAWKYSFFKEI
jgi:hypothetical protein